MTRGHLNGTEFLEEAEAAAIVVVDRLDDLW